jgi:RND family efflux transporter MFP subunit
MRRILTIALAALALGQSPQLLAAETEEQKPSIKTATIEQREMPRSHLLDGVVEAVHRGTISAQTRGQVQEVLFDVEDFVEAGAVLVRLNDKEQQASLQQAKAATQEAEAKLVEATKRQQRIAEVYKKKLVSSAAMDQVDADLKAATARRDAAQAKLDQAKEQIEYTLIRAPYAGIVTERHIEVGEVASPGRKLMSGISLQNLRVTVDVPQSLLPAIRQHKQGNIQQADGSWVKAEKLTIFPFADSGSNTFKVRLDLPRGVQNLFPGMFVKTAFVTGARRELVVPQEAVVYRSEVTGIYVVDKQGRPSLRHVRLGRALPDGSLVVLSGLEPGEQIALDPVAAGVMIKRGADTENRSNG